MEWKQGELVQLETIVHKIEEDLAPLPGKEIIVLCCREGQVALWLGRKMAGRGRIVGLDLSEESLAQARRQAQVEGLEGVVQFQKADMYRLPFADGTMDAVVSEFIVYPTLLVTQIGQDEMARVLRPGGKVLLTDVIVTRPVSQEAKNTLNTIGLDYLCEATVDDFRGWMEEAGLQGVETVDFTPLVRALWQRRREKDLSTEHGPAYALLLDDPGIGVGRGLFYIYVRGVK